MNFDSDGFISYAHLENLCLKKGAEEWSTNLPTALQIKVTQLRGKSSQNWRDPWLEGKDVFSDKLDLLRRDQERCDSISTVR